MQGLPNHGDKVKVWPMPGRRAQMDERPVDHMGGGRFLPPSGAIVEWSPFMHGQLLGGALLLHPPPCEEHDFGEERDGGKMELDACQLCGRDMEAAQKYDVHLTEGKDAAEAAADSLPQHPHELDLHPQSEEIKAVRKEEEDAAAERAKAEAEEAAARAKDEAEAEAAAKAAADAQAADKKQKAAAAPKPDASSAPDESK